MESKTKFTWIIHTRLERNLQIFKIMWYFNQAWWFTLVILALERWRQEFEIILSLTVSSRPAWVIWDLSSKNFYKIFKMWVCKECPKSYSLWTTLMKAFWGTLQMESRRYRVMWNTKGRTQQALVLLWSNLAWFLCSVLCFDIPEPGNHYND